MSNSSSRDERTSPTRIIVKFAEPARESQSSLDESCDRICELIPGGSLARPPSKSGRAVFNVDQGANLKQLARTISEFDGIEYAEPDEIDFAT